MPPCDSYEENKKYLMKLFFQILYLWKHSEKFSLINGAEFHRSNEWRGFFRLLSNMGRIGRDKLYKENYTFYEFALELFRHQPYGWLPSTIITESMDIIIREDARRVFEFVRYEFPELFCKFHTTYNLQYKGGEFVDVS